MPIDIVISSKGVSDQDFSRPGNAGVSPTQGIQSGTSGKELVTRSLVANKLMQVGVTAGKNLIDFAKSNYGEITGDYIGQTNIDNAFSIANAALGAGSAIIGGAIVGGVGGAVLGAATYVGSSVISYAQSEFKYNRSIAKANAGAQMRAEMMGTIFTGGNR